MNCQIDTRAFSTLALAAALSIGLAGEAESHPIAGGITAPVMHALRIADSEKGKSLFRGRCGACHTVDPNGPSKTGPNLHGVFGRKAGSLPGFSYSGAMKAAGVVWGEETLDAYLTDPRKSVPGDKMAFPGLPNNADRDSVIDFLRQSSP